jgi:hypothetical protein
MPRLFSMFSLSSKIRMVGIGYAIILGNYSFVSNNERSNDYEIAKNRFF